MSSCFSPHLLDSMVLEPTPLQDSNNGAPTCFSDISFTHNNHSANDGGDHQESLTLPPFFVGGFCNHAHAEAGRCLIPNTNMQCPIPNYNNRAPLFSIPYETSNSSGMLLPLSAAMQSSYTPSSWDNGILNTQRATTTPDDSTWFCSSASTGASTAGYISESSTKTSTTTSQSDSAAGAAGSLADRWQERMQDLARFKQEYGHCSVPTHWPQNTPLAQWVKRQRYQYKTMVDGKRSTLTPQRKFQLDQLGFIWDAHSAIWEERLEELRAFRNKYGHANVPPRHKDNPQLSVWVKCQRRQFRLFCTQGPSHSNITLERIGKLADLDFAFDPRVWKKHEKIVLAALRKNKDNNGRENGACCSESGAAAVSSSMTHKQLLLEMIPADVLSSAAQAEAASRSLLVIPPHRR